jgi:integrase/recombinase XerD
MNNIEMDFSNFLTFCKIQKNLSEKTIKAYTIDTKQFISFLDNYENVIDVSEINRDILRAYLQSLFTSYKIKSIKRKLACLKAFFNYLEFEDRIMVNPFRKLRIKLKEPFNLPVVMTLNEIETLLKIVYQNFNNIRDTASYSYIAFIRDIAVLELLFATGLRVSELCNLKKNEIDLDNAFVKVSGKGGKERVIFIGNDEVKKALVMYRDNFAGEMAGCEFFFVNRLRTRLSEQSVRFMIRKYVLETGLQKHITPHVFRHSFATLLLEEGVDIKYIQNFLGHSSIMTTQIYTHVNKEKQKEILAEKHPRGNFKVGGGAGNE